MPFRTWMYVFAFGLVLPATQIHAQDVPENRPPHVEVLPPIVVIIGQNRPSTDLTPALEKIETAIRDLITEEDQVESQRQLGEQNRDLIAQEDMAKWAFWMTLATAVGIVATLIGLYLIYRTLYYTKRAADYTRDMLTQAKISNDAATTAAVAAIASNKGTAKFGEMGSRAYLTVSNLSIEFTGDLFFLYFELSNVGASPAFEVEAVFLAFSDGNIVGTPKIPENQYFGHFPLAAIVTPKTSDPFHITVFPSNSISTDFRETPCKEVEIVEVLIKYQTVFDRERGGLSSELSFRVKIPALSEISDENLTSGRISVELEQSFRSGWVPAYLKMERFQPSRKIIHQYPDN